ncbi:DUF2809 domain-containing protein [Aureisphaera sp. CAU 1614]|uniref:DUF2809 domain-containing protein n=1 Tax=Halomarinibacterium sedimenti TaxID=2857106 RepID=A0A9X1FRV3_9FLAO|nr:DUF2809 domain-containing protein [Halomarinibacterium sedimenti]MBW2938924.1 DUF2809 domain-containing protein [Halomarinibacterium sedimenti]
MNKVGKESSFTTKRKALLLEKTNRYFWIFLLLLTIEVVIALFQFHKFIRGFVGDVLVIPLLYYFGRWITRFSANKLLLAVLLLAISVEIIQWFNLFPLLGIESKLFYILIGNTFDPLDLGAHCIGFLTVLFLNKLDV